MYSNNIESHKMYSNNIESNFKCLYKKSGNLLKAPRNSNIYISSDSAQILPCIVVVGDHSRG